MTGGLGQFDISLKQCVRDDLLGLLHLIDERLELVEVLEPELQLAELRRDKLLVVRLFGEQMVLNAEFQTDPDATMAERMHAYACQVYVLRKLPTFGVVIYLRPQKEDPPSRFAWSVRQKTFWQYDFLSLNVSDYQAAEALATGSPLLAALSPLMQQASLNTVQEAARIIWQSEHDRDTKERFLTGLVVFAGDLAERPRIQQAIAQVIMEYDVIQEFKGYKDILQEGLQKGLQQGLQQGQTTTLRHQFERRLGRPLSDAEATALAGKLQALGGDRVSDMVLDTPEPDRLLAWLLAP